jgi:hypothetical protein
MIHEDYLQSIEKFDHSIKTLKNSLQQEFNHYERELESLGEHDLLQSIMNESDQMLVDFEIPEDVETENKDILEVVDTRKKRTQHILAQFEVVMQHAKSRLSQGIDEMEANMESSHKMHEMGETITRSQRLSGHSDKNRSSILKPKNTSSPHNESKRSRTLGFLSKSQPLTTKFLEEPPQEVNEIENEEPRDLNSFPIPRPVEEKIQASEFMQHILTATPRSKYSNKMAFLSYQHTTNLTHITPQYLLLC